MKKILALVLAIAMIAMFVVPMTAFAADDPAACYTYTGANDGADTSFLIEGLRKTVKADSANAEVPNETYTFTVTGGTADTTNNIYAGEVTSVSNNTIAFTNTDSFDTNGEVTKAPANDLTVTVPAYTQPGVYHYQIQESAGSAADEIYDDSVYDIYVYVDDNREVYKVITKDSEGTKVPPLFENDIYTVPLEVSKTVTGNLGDKSKDFAFTLSVEANERYAAAQQYTVTKTDASGGTSISTLTIGTDYSFNLKDGESISIENLPYGLAYTVVENDYTGSNGGYTTTYSVNGGQATTGLSASGTLNNGFTAGSAAGSNTVGFTNNKAENDTGVVLAIGGPLAMVGLGGLGFGLLKKKKED